MGAAKGFACEWLTADGTRADCLLPSCVCTLGGGCAANNRNVLSPSRGVWKSTIQAWAGSVSPDGREGGCVPGLSPGMGEAVCALCLHVVVSPCVSESLKCPLL